MNMRQKILLLALMLHFLKGQAQDEKQACSSIQNPKAENLFEKGIDKKKYYFKERKEFLLKAVEEVPDYAAALNALGNCAITVAKGDGTSFAPAQKYFSKAVELCPDVNPYCLLLFRTDRLWCRKIRGSRQAYGKIFDIR